MQSNVYPTLSDMMFRDSLCLYFDGCRDEAEVHQDLSASFVTRFPRLFVRKMLQTAEIGLNGSLYTSNISSKTNQYK